MKPERKLISVQAEDRSRWRKRNQPGVRWNVCKFRVAGTRKYIAVGGYRLARVGSRSITPCKSGLLDDAAARVIREGRDTPLSLLPRLPVTLMMVVRHPRAPGLLVLQRVVARPLPEALEKTLLLRRVAALRIWKTGALSLVRRFAVDLLTCCGIEFCAKSIYSQSISNRKFYYALFVHPRNIGFI